MSGKTANFFTTRQLARMWQVSEATIKRWADAGHLHNSRTLGGHRRFALSEVVKFQNERGLGAAVESNHAALTSSAPHGRVGLNQDAAAQFFEAIARGHESAATAVLLEGYLNGVPLVKILDETVTGAMHRVGKLW